MPNIKRVLLEGYCYHLITRGNQKQKVFRCKEDYLKYLALLKRFKRKYKFNLYAYCLMPNHVHMLGETEETPQLSRFMHDLSMTYTRYFNSKYKEAGHLWQSRFKNKVICKDKYLIDCMNYIEMNPLRANLVNSAVEYEWSSYKSRAFDKKDRLIDILTLI